MNFGPSLCNINCGACGHSADIELFSRTPIFGELPAGHFQCPGCGRAWRIVKGKVSVSPTRYYELAGIIKVIPAALVIEPNRTEAIQPPL